MQAQCTAFGMFKRTNIPGVMWAYKHGGHDEVTRTDTSDHHHREHGSHTLMTS